MEKGSGILLHISSLPSKYGIGTFGKEARKFIRFLNASKQKYWQVLPLNPTSYGDSPYQGISSYALNPYFIDLDYLIKREYISKEDVINLKAKKGRFVDYGYLYQTRFAILKKASVKAYEKEEKKIASFYRLNKKWLYDYALFMTIKKIENDVAFSLWPRDLKLHKKNALTNFAKEHIEELKFWIYVQYEAFRQYKSLKKYAKRKNVKIIGDMPFYVASDSVDVWANANMFKVNREHYPTKIAGVPPDYFSENGQLWGNPIYDWDKLKKRHYKWWVQRLKFASKLFDYIRLDHFRAFASYYEIKANAKNAKKGIWKQGPGLLFFETMQNKIKNLNIIAEDLGIIEDDVKKLLKETKFPGLKVYQFAFSDYEECLKKDLKLNNEIANMTAKEIKEMKLVNPFLPHNYLEECVAYIGTHDNDVLSNFLLENKDQIPAMLDYLNLEKEEDIYDTLIGSLFRSNAKVCIFTMQDLLKLPKETRMNTPGKESGNWQFRILKKEISKELSSWLKIMVEESKR